MAPATPFKVCTVFVWQALSKCGVYEGWAGPKHRVGFSAVMWSLSVFCVYVDAERCMVGEWWKEGQFSLVELGSCLLGAQVLVYVQELSRSDVGRGLAVLSKRICVLLSCACATRWVRHTFQDGGGGLGWNWLLLRTSSIRSAGLEAYLSYLFLDIRRNTA